MAINLKIAALVSIIGLTGGSVWVTGKAISSGDRANTKEVKELRLELKEDINVVSSTQYNHGLILSAQTEILKDIKEDLEKLIEGE